MRREKNMPHNPIDRDSFIERDARRRAIALLDPGTFRELLDPFEQLASPWLPRQGIVAQADDGAVVARGTLDGQPAVVLAIEGAFQGGSMGEVSGAKIAGSLELAEEDNRAGIPTRAVIVFETGGVRLQEANLGLAAIAEIQAAIRALREHGPVIGITAGVVGCFGGMSIAAGLCSHLLMTREARLGLNGPQVIEQEAGIEEYDSGNRPFIWSLTGGEQRAATGLADLCIEDDSAAIRAQVLAWLRAETIEQPRSERVSHYLERLAAVNAARQATAADVRALYTARNPA